MSILQGSHFGWWYIVTLVLVVAIIKFLFGLLLRQKWSRLDHILGVTTSIVITIQWLLGLGLWAPIPNAWFQARGSVNFWEHATTMTLAVAAAHLGWSRAKRATSDTAKYRQAFFSFLIAGLLVALGVARIKGWMM